MTEHTAVITWERSGAVFTDDAYSRGHVWTFDGGVEVAASASPHVVSVPYSDPHSVDPEEAFVASIASCHMLWFLGIAASRRFVVDDYRDEAVGVMEKNREGRTAITRVLLHPRVRFSGNRLPSSTEHARLHEIAHDKCFIANSVKTHIQCDPRIDGFEGVPD